MRRKAIVLVAVCLALVAGAFTAVEAGADTSNPNGPVGTVIADQTCGSGWLAAAYLPQGLTDRDQYEVTTDIPGVAGSGRQNYNDQNGGTLNVWSASGEQSGAVGQVVSGSVSLQVFIASTSGPLSYAAGPVVTKALPLKSNCVGTTGYWNVCRNGAEQVGVAGTSLLPTDNIGSCAGPVPAVTTCKARPGNNNGYAVAVVPLALGTGEPYTDSPSDIVPVIGDFPGINLGLGALLSSGCAAPTPPPPPPPTYTFCRNGDTVQLGDISNVLPGDTAGSCPPPAPPLPRSITPLPDLCRDGNVVSDASSLLPGDSIVPKGSVQPVEPYTGPCALPQTPAPPVPTVTVCRAAGYTLGLPTAPGTPLTVPATDAQAGDTVGTDCPATFSSVANTIWFATGVIG